MTAMKEKRPLSRNEMRNSHGEDSSYFLGWQEYEKNPYHSITNPSGIIQMGLAENQLSLDLLESWLADNPDALMLKKGNQSMLKELALFQDYHGVPAFKKAMVEFMSQIRGNKVRFDPDRLVLTAGATSANEALVFCLAECGDAFLLPTPYYPGFDRDLKWRTGVEIVPIHCSSSNGFRLTRAALEKAYKQAKKLKLKVKGVLITNPSNPLSTTSTRAELDILLNFIADKRIHIVSDEIYAGTVFDVPDFTSVLEALLNTEGKDNIRDRVHIVTSLSKDLGLPGFRVGAIYSENSEVISTATKMSSFGLVSSQTQFLLSELLSDKNFVSNYIAVNQKRLRQRQTRLVTGLNRIGIQCLEGNAGLFSWVDMRHLLSSSTMEGEIKLWGKMVHNVRLNISPGSSCHCTEPGWFRVCFANMSEDTLDLAIQRLESFVNGSNHVVPVTWLQKLSRKKWLQKLPPKDR